MYLRLAVATGARRGELCGLRWTDVDLDAGEVRIHRSIAASDVNSQSLVEKGTKTHQGRVIALDDGSGWALREELKSMRVRALAVGAPYAANAYLFSADLTGARPWHPDAVTSTFRRIARKAGVTGVRLHDLRHYHGTMLADLGVPMPAVRDRLGHRDLQTTNLYAHGRRSADRSAADLIGDHLDGTTTLRRKDA
jgi:integrase